MRKSYVLLFALIVLLSTAMSVQAMESKTMERHNGASASASWDQKDGTINTHTYLSVTETDDGTDIYVSTEASGPDFYSSGSGYLFTKDDVFKINNKLNSASLSEVQVEVYDWYTGKTETFTVQADWTGVGDVSTGSSSYTSKNGDYTFKSSESSSYREASATGSINGYELGVEPCFILASLSNFKSASVSMEK